MDRFITVEMKQDGEKLFRVHLNHHDGKIIRITISGDFFIMPEESLETIETSLQGVALSGASISAAIERIIAEQAITMIGISTGSLVKAILMAGSR